MFEISENVGWRILNDDQVIVVDCQSTQIFLLSYVSSLIWRNLEKCEFNTILDKILDEYDITKEIAKQDLEEFIEKIRNKKLIV